MPPAEANETPKYELPTPVNTGAEANVDKKDVSPESVTSPETAKGPSSPKFGSPTLVFDQSLPLPNLNDQHDSGVTPAPTITGNPAIADDNDLIEKEWVNKAKKIIGETSEDPYKQSQEITLFKADYMEKRYNKVIKVAD